MSNAACEAYGDIEDQHTEKDEEESVVGHTHAVAHPRTVVVEAENAESAVRAMHSSGWTVDVAGFAVLHSRQSAFDTSEESVHAGVG